MFPIPTQPSEKRTIKRNSAAKWKSRADVSLSLQEKQGQFAGQNLQLTHNEPIDPIKSISKMDRSLKKSLSFRVVATMGTFAVAWVITGNPFVSLPIAGAQALTNTTIYYWHEVYWNKKNERN